MRRLSLSSRLALLFAGCTAVVSLCGGVLFGRAIEVHFVELDQQLMEARLLWHVHLGDNNRLPPGTGMIDFATIVATLKSSGYSGYLSAELLGKPDPDTAAEQTIQAMRPLVG